MGWELVGNGRRGWGGSAPGEQPGGAGQCWWVHRVAPCARDASERVGEKGGGEGGEHPEESERDEGDDPALHRASHRCGTCPGVLRACGEPLRGSVWECMQLFSLSLRFSQFACMLRMRSGVHNEEVPSDQPCPHV
jgi:hypothetical protein